jgi:drug/metabolite transporter (DMT)-like permease
VQRSLVDPLADRPRGQQAGLCNGLSSILWLIGLHEAGAAKAAALSSTAPIFAAPLAALALRERMTSAVLVGTALTVGGVALVL